MATRKPEDFVHLHVHADSSLLDGFGTIPEMVQETLNIGQKALAVTDHGNMHGVYDLYTHATNAGIKPIAGIEAYMAPSTVNRKHKSATYFTAEGGRGDVSGRGAYTHITLLAENNTGLHNLYKMGLLSYTEGFFQKNRIDLELLAEHGEGIIATTGCPSGEIQTRLRLGQKQEAYTFAGKLQDALGKNNVFVELMDHAMTSDLERSVRNELLEMAQKLNMPLVATNDVHYTTQQQAHSHEEFLCVQTRSVMSTPPDHKGGTRFAFEGNSYYLKTAQEMADIFPDHPEALNNTLLIAERSNITIEPDPNLRPKLDIPDGLDENQHIHREAIQGLQRRLPEKAQNEKYLNRLEKELSILKMKDYVGYFLVVSDFVRWAKNNQIPTGYGRGSCGGSLVAYCLDITDIDPLKYDLLFERFINPERDSPPDIDMDFNDTDREKVIQYVKQKYGDNKVAQIATFGKIGAKAAIKDSIRIKELPYTTGETLSKALPDPISGKAITLKEVYNPEADRYPEAGEFRDLVKKIDAEKVIETAKNFEGRTRSTGVHAAALVISSKPVVDSVPMMQRQNDGAMITQWDYPTCEHLGLLKVDFLGLRNLGVVGNTLKHIQKTRGENINLETIISSDMDNPKTYQLLAKGDSNGVFQLDSCLSGDTLVSGRKIKELYANYKKGEGIQTTYSIDLSTGKRVRNKILRFVESGIKPVYRLVSESGRMVEATEDHKFMTDSGWKRLGDIDINVDKVLVDQTVKTLTVDNTAQPKLHKNTPTRIPKTTQWETIQNITYVNKQMTYDISMKAPLNNFLANGFMVHNSGMQSLMKQLKPTDFNDIAALLALYRPGPMGVGAHVDYALRKNGEQKVDYIHPELEKPLKDILGETHGLCLSGDTLIWDAITGERCRIDEIREKIETGKFYTFSVNEKTGEVETKKVSRWFDNGEKQIYKLKTSDGRVLKASAEHPILTINGYKKASELQPGTDLLAVSGQIMKHKNVNGLTNEEASFLGYMIGDGYINLYQNSFTNSSPSMLKHVETLSKILFDDAFIHKQERSRKEKYYTTQLYFLANPKGTARGTVKDNKYRTTFKLNKWFKERIGITEKTLSRDKSIPKIVFSSSNESIANFIAGLWDTDGYISKDTAFYKTISKKLAEDLQYLLDKLGISSTILNTGDYINPKFGKTQSYGIYVYDSIFWNIIVPLLKHEEKSKVAIKPSSAVSVNSGINFEIFKKDMTEIIISKGIDDERKLKTYNKTGTMGLRTINSFMDENNFPVLKNQLQVTNNKNFVKKNLTVKTYLDNFASAENIFNSKQKWVTLKTVEIESAEKVYDIEVGDNHNFYANGILVHNCIYQEEIMLIAQKVANYTLAQADNLRRAMGKKKKSVLDAEYVPFSEGMRKNGYSEEAIKDLWNVLVPFADYGFNKCVSDKTIIRMADGSARSIREVYNMFNRGEEVYVQSMWADGEVKPHKVANVVSTGMKEVYRLKTKNGRTVDLTPEHRLLTTRGYLELQNIVVGEDELIVADKVDGGESVTGRRFSGDRLGFVSSYGSDKTRMAEFLIENGIDFEMHKPVGKGECDFYFEGLYWEMDGMDRHVSYFENKYVDIPFVVVTPEDYQERIADVLNLEHVRNGDVVVSVEKISRKLPTIDIEMAEDGPKNFLTWKGIVSHNSHSVGYGMLSYLTAYLKANYPAEFMSSLLSSVSDDTDKTALYLNDCRSMGITVDPPNINESNIDYEPASADHIHFGFKAIRGVGEGVAAEIVAARRDVPFKDFNDFVTRVPKGVANKRILEALALGGAFDVLGVSRRSVVEFVPDLLKDLTKIHRKAAKSDDVSLFDLTAEFNVLVPDVGEWGKLEKLKKERHALGLYVSGHPLEGLDMATAGGVKVSDLTGGVIPPMQGWIPRDAKPLKLAGIVTSLSKKRTKKGETFALGTVEDLTGTIPFVMFPKAFKDFGEFLELDGVYQLSGFHRERDIDGISFTVDALRPLEFSETGKLSFRVKLTEKQYTAAKHVLLEKLAKHEATGAGSTNVIVSLKNDAGDVWEEVLDITVKASPVLSQEVREVFGMLSIGRWRKS